MYLPLEVAMGAYLYLEGWNFYNEVFFRMNLPLALEVNNLECLGLMIVNEMKFKLLYHPLGLGRMKCVASIFFFFFFLVQSNTFRNGLDLPSMPIQFRLNYTYFI